MLDVLVFEHTVSTPLGGHTTSYVIADVTECDFNNFCGVMTFTVSDLLADETVASGDAENVKMLDNVAGSLFCTGVKMNGEYIWKSVEQTTQGLTMYLWFSSATGNSSAGWFLSDQMWLTEKMKSKMTVLIALWMPHDGCSLPGQFHFPYWSRKALQDKDAICFVNAYDLLSSKLADAQLEAQVYRDHELATSSASSSAAADHDDVKQKRDTHSHGGWLPKVCNLMAAWYAHDLKYVGKLMDKHYKSSAVLRSLVDKKL